MASVRALLARVQRLEAGRNVLSPIAGGFGSTDAWEEAVRAGMNTGALDKRDMPAIIASVRRWDRDGVWVLWQ